MGDASGGEADWPGRGLLHDLAACLRFYSRLSVPRLPGEPDPHAVPDFTTIPRMLPVAGLILSLPPALTLAAGWWLGLGPFLVATLAVAVGVMLTGALHEDGL
ncbi:adenosylcobinamide-GDP ribazoletransferase, partial [Methylobacterium trifolii]